ncbi:hypothetical protein [Chromobacterium sp. Beijing]|uniref:hypothetical protein n=1 Tax=Chromobacterium sp. Beijing TaxID=2735795 RepID=UPI001F25761A|nr:hypothetical protein [Chromobacterium sp. Beijing]UJB30169.1 hypothetical protein HQN78_03325 [Chromobacterium sp. Beijing]
MQTKSFPDFIVDDEGDVFGYEFKFIANFSARSFPPSVVSALLRGYLEVNEGRLQNFTLLIGLPLEYAEYFDDLEWREDVLRRSCTLLDKYPAGSIIFGVVAGDKFGEVMSVKYS